MGEDQKHHLAALVPKASRIDGVPEIAFDHAEYRFDLPALAIGFLVKVSAHQLALFTLQRFWC